LLIIFFSGGLKELAGGDRTYNMVFTILYVLTTLKLWPEKYKKKFYAGTIIVKCPSLTNVIHCKKIC
jgi:hypothetical protein